MSGQHFPAGEVEEALARLKVLLGEVGPTISKALTSLVLAQPGAGRRDALKHLALTLSQAAVGAGGEGLGVRHWELTKRSVCIVTRGSLARSPPAAAAR